MTAHISAVLPCTLPALLLHDAEQRNCRLSLASVLGFGGTAITVSVPPSVQRREGNTSSSYLVGSGSSLNKEHVSHPSELDENVYPCGPNSRRVFDVTAPCLYWAEGGEVSRES